MTSDLLSYDQALDCLRANIRSLNRVHPVNLDQALGHALAEAVAAREPNPRFDNAAVDGFAVASPWRRAEARRVIGHVAAGEVFIPLEPEGALRVLTGAPVPPNTWAVAMQEDVSVEDSSVLLKADLHQGFGVRRAGSDFGSGEPLLRRGQQLSSGAVGLLASQGLERVNAFERPSVQVLVTGDELASDPGPAQIRDSNGPMLESLLRSVGIAELSSEHVRDDRDALSSRLFKSADLTLVSGGASVGDRDFLPGLMRDLGAVHFHGVAMRPGKPVLFGEVRGKPIFGLPGNPASVFVAFHAFVIEAIRRLSGFETCAPEWLEVPLRYEHSSYGRDDFLRCRWSDGAVEPVGEHGSFGLRSLAEAQWLMRVPAGSSSRGVTMRQGMKVCG